jgi:hypothetical protein
MNAKDFDDTDPGVCPPLPRNGLLLGQSLMRLGLDQRPHSRCPEWIPLSSSLPRGSFFDDTLEERTMLLIREVLYCKPGKVRPMVEKFKAMASLNEEAGLGRMRLLTDFAGERYWTIVAEFEVETLQDFEDMMAGKGMTEELGKKFEEIMKDYHDLVDHGRREIYKIERP